MTLWAVVPVKALAAAKSRLAPILTPAERRALAAALLADVLEALSTTPALARVLVVSADPAALALAEAAGATPVEEPPAVVPDEPTDEAALNAALDHAATLAAAAGAAALLALPADLPLVTAADVAAVLAAAPPAPSVLLVPARDGGTSILLRQPPLAIPARFGPASLRAHLQAAAARSVPARLMWRANLGLDLDGPADLQRLVAFPPRGRAQALLAAWRVAERWQSRTDCAAIGLPLDYGHT
ncbi:MAG TPA: 2-phospho-L-lactate guanylyltransferase [Chloroflexota bacterium]|nr:2-phospho-L-lactate guanylyltransferase [Chloroflexota bacterium]